MNLKHKFFYIPMNWNAVLQQIKEDFESFLESGGWKFLHENEHAEAEDKDPELAEDLEFNKDESSGESDDSSLDFSDKEDEEDYSSEADDGESEGLSWDELEKKAYEEDNTAA